MTAHNRHVRGDTEDILVEVRGNVVVESGDHMFLNTQTGDVDINWAPDNRAYPFGWARSTSTELGFHPMTTVYHRFIGVAMKSSKSGVTEKLTIATAGVFRKNLGASQNVTAGFLVSATTIVVSAALITANGVTQGISVGTGDMSTVNGPSTAYLGYCTKTESGATVADYELLTTFNDPDKDFGLDFKA